MQTQKIDLNAAMAAFLQSGGKVQEVKEGERTVDQKLRYCKCGCEGDYTDHTMRIGEGRFRDQY